MSNKHKKTGRNLKRGKNNNKLLNTNDDFPQKLLFQQALKQHQSGKLREAESLYHQILTSEPNHSEALHYLGMIAHQVKNYEVAVNLISRALKARPDYFNAQNNLGIVFNDMGKFDQAVACYRQALNLKPDYAEAYNNLGNTLFNQAKLDEAVTIFRKAVTLKPDFAEAYYNLGKALSESGKLAEATTCYKKALTLKPNYVQAYRNLSFITKYTEVDDVVRAMKRFYLNNKTPVKDRIDLGFALGKIFEDLKDYDKSFHYIFEANRLKRSSYEFSIQADKDFFARIKKTFSTEFFLSHYGYGCHDKTPIFILGMPRSGTTLVEHILASHSHVFGAGELYILNNLTNDICKYDAKTQYPECLLDLDVDVFMEMGSNYIEKIRKFSKDKQNITDKMPSNYLRVGLIKAILPNAKVVHCVREPMDTCFSIFKKNFNVLHGYAYDLVELGQYYNLYRDLMKHWERVMPGFMYTLKYEDLISNQKNQTQGLLDYCGLPWDKNCLTFHKTERRVSTASFAQVRQPIYNKSVELWKRYEEQLEPLRKAIYN